VQAFVNHILFTKKLRSSRLWLLLLIVVLTPRVSHGFTFDETFMKALGNAAVAAKNQCQQDLEIQGLPATYVYAAVLGVCGVLITLKSLHTLHQFRIGKAVEPEKKNYSKFKTTFAFVQSVSVLFDHLFSDLRDSLSDADQQHSLLTLSLIHLMQGNWFTARHYLKKYGGLNKGEITLIASDVSGNEGAQTCPLCEQPRILKAYCSGNGERHPYCEECILKHIRQMLQEGRRVECPSRDGEINYVIEKPWYEKLFKMILLSPFEQGEHQGRGRAFAFFNEMAKQVDKHLTHKAKHTEPAVILSVVQESGR